MHLAARHFPHRACIFCTFPPPSVREPPSVPLRHADPRAGSRIPSEVLHSVAAAGLDLGRRRPPLRRRRPRVASAGLDCAAALHCTACLRRRPGVAPALHSPLPWGRRRPRPKVRRGPTASSPGIGAAPPRPEGLAVKRAEQEQDCCFGHFLWRIPFSVN